jgi:hypothetical protein
MATISIHEGIQRAFAAQLVIAGFDCTGANEPSAPRSAQLAGYDTGSGGIPWTPRQYAAHPGAIHIDQDPAASDPAADVLDVENGAATLADCPVWSKKAHLDYASVVRPGQRLPAIYESASNVTEVVDHLISGGVTSGVGLWVANWNLTETQAIDEVLNASGPFPIIGAQYANGTWGDFDVWSNAWLSMLSGSPVASNPVHGLQVIGRGFTHLDVSWNDQQSATGYTVEALWPATNGAVVHRVDFTSAPCRVRNLLPQHTYEIRVRAHPGGSVGSDANTHGTTR